MDTNIIRMYLPDKTHMSGTIEATDTIGDAIQMLADRYGLENIHPFGLYEVNRVTGMERWLDPRLHPYKIMAYWGEDNLVKTFGMAVHKKGGSGAAAAAAMEGADDEAETLGGRHGDFHPLSPESMYVKPAAQKDTTATFKFLFRARSRTRAPPSEDVELDILYAQAVSEVVSGRYRGFVAPPDAVSLAGLQAHVSFGNYIGTVHHMGFLTDRVGDFIPAEMLSDRNVLDWEEAILREHAKCIGCTAREAKMLYLEMLHHVPTYGSTWFPVEQGNSQNLVVLAVNMLGLHLLDRVTYEVLKFIPKDKLMQWSTGGKDGKDTNTVTVSFDDSPEGSVEAVRRGIRLQSEQGKEICTLIDEYHKMTDDMLFGASAGAKRKKAARYDSKQRCYLVSRMRPGDRRAEVNTIGGIQIGDEVIIDPGTALEERAVVSGYGSLIFERGVRFAHAVWCVIEPPQREVPLDVDQKGGGAHPLATTGPERRRREVEARDDLHDGITRPRRKGEVAAYDLGDDGYAGRGSVPKERLSRLVEAPVYGGGPGGSGPPPPPSLLSSMGLGGDDDVSAAPTREGKRELLKSGLPADWLMGQDGEPLSRSRGRANPEEELRRELLRRDEDNKKLRDQVNKAKELLRKFDVDVVGDADPMVEAMKQLRIQERELSKGQQEVDLIRRDLEQQQARFQRERANMLETNAKLLKKVARSDGNRDPEAREIIEGLQATITKLQKSERNAKIKLHSVSAEQAEYSVGHVGADAGVDSPAVPVALRSAGGADGADVRPPKKEIPVSLRSADHVSIATVKAVRVVIPSEALRADSSRAKGSGAKVAKPETKLDKSLAELPFFSDWISAPSSRGINLHTGLPKPQYGLTPVASMATFTPAPAPARGFLAALAKAVAEGGKPTDLDDGKERFQVLYVEKEPDNIYPYDAMDEPVARGTQRPHPLLSLEKPSSRLASAKVCALNKEPVSAGVLGIGGNKHQCLYCGRVVCSDHVKSNFVPWEVVKEGDFDPKDLCDECAAHIQLMLDRPMLPFNQQMGTTLLKKVSKHIKRLRGAVEVANELMTDTIYPKCPARHFLADVIPLIYAPLLTKESRLSIQDVVNLSHGTFVGGLERATDLLRKHSHDCLYCSGRQKSTRVPRIKGRPVTVLGYADDHDSVAPSAGKKKGGRGAGDDDQKSGGDGKDSAKKNRAGKGADGHSDDDPRGSGSGREKSKKAQGQAKASESASGSKRRAKK